MSATLGYVLILLVLALTVVVIVLCVYLVKLIDKMTETMTSFKELTDLTKRELEPALKSFNNVLKTVDNVSVVTNRNFDILKNILTTLLGASCIALTNVKNRGGFFSGLVSGFNAFRKRR